MNPSQSQSAGRAGHTTVQGFPLFPLFGRNETTALTSTVVTPRVVTPEVVLGNRFQQQSVLKSGWAPCSATPEPFRETPKAESDAFGWPFTRDPGETPSAIRSCAKPDQFAMGIQQECVGFYSPEESRKNVLRLYSHERGVGSGGRINFCPSNIPADFTQARISS